MPDILIIGAGMAGASAAYFLARRFDVLLLEREDQPGYHTTGRSAALYSQAYGNAAIRALTVASKAFFDAPPAGFCEQPLLTPRGLVLFGRADQAASLDTAFRDGRRFVPEIQMLDGAGVCGLVPALRPDYAAGGVYEPEAADMDVNAMHRGFLGGVPLRRNAEVEGLEPGGPGWRVALRGGDSLEARIVVNAAGAWADEVAMLAGAAPIGLVPKRRTAFTFPAETGMWPMAVDVDEQFYFKPESGRALGSLADETPSPPCDAQPEEIDVAMAVDRIERATNFQIRRIERRWAGLRSFVADKTPVLGFDPVLPGFFWCAGQGGYGIQTAPAMGMAVATLAAGEGLPPALRTLGLEEADLGPARCRNGAS